MSHAASPVRQFSLVVLVVAATAGLDASPRSIALDRAAAARPALTQVARGDGGADHGSGLLATGRNMRALGNRRVTVWGDSPWEFGVSGTPTTSQNWALNGFAEASSLEAQSPAFAAGNAFDASTSTRWSSAFADPQWLSVRLPQRIAVNRVVIRWETAYGADYLLQVSDDRVTWTTIRTVTNGDGGIDDLTGLSGSGLYVRMFGTRRATPWGYSIYELEVYGDPVAAPPSGGLPAGWTQQDIGAVGVAGSATFDDAAFTVKGSGSDIWGSADEFHYVHRPVNGSARLLARVSSIQNTNAFAKAGIMFRDGTAGDAKQVMLNVKPDGCTEFLARISAGSPTEFVGGNTCAPRQWLMLDRAE
jgi:hypothetical protein